MSKRDRKRKEQDRRKAVARQQTKRSKTDLSAKTTIAPATATLVLTKEGELRIDLTLLPCSRCGRKGRVGDTPMELGTSEWGEIATCFRFERSTKELLCKQCLNEIGYSDDPSVDDEWFAKVRDSNEAHLSILKDNGIDVPCSAKGSLDIWGTNRRKKTDGMGGCPTIDGFAESACTYASSVFKCGKQRLLGGVPLSAKAYFFTEEKVVTLSDTPFEDMLDNSNHLRFSLPLFAQALGASAVLGIFEAWQASQCAACGETDDGQFSHGCCDTCGAEAVAPVDNPHRVEVLLGQVQFKDGSPSRVWLSEIQRNATGLVTGFVDRAAGTVVEGTDGRLTGLWEAPSEQTDAFIRCLPIVARELKRHLPAKVLEMSAMLEEMPVSPDEHLRINMKRLRAHTRVLPWDASGAITEREEDARL